MAVKCCVLIFMFFSGVSTAQEINSFEYYRTHVSSGVIFWEDPPQSGSVGNCVRPFIARDFIEQHIKNCKITSKAEGRCQRRCGLYESFDIVCKEYFHTGLGKTLHQWFPHQAIPLCTHDEIKREEYRGKSDSVIFWDPRQKPEKNTTSSLWCRNSSLFIDRIVTAEYINNCDHDINNHYNATCTFGCGNKKAKFEIFCHRDGDNKDKWFPTKNILHICDDQKHYMEHQDAVIFWHEHPEPESISVDKNIYCNYPYLQTNVTKRYIHNCTTENKRNGTCYFLCKNSNSQIKVDILCWKNAETGDELKWYPLKNYSQHCGNIKTEIGGQHTPAITSGGSSTKWTTSMSSLQSMSSRQGKSLHGNETTAVNTATTSAINESTTISPSINSTLENDTMPSIAVADKTKLPYLLGGIVIVLGIIIIISMIIVCKGRSAITDEDEKTEELEMNNAAFETNDPDYDYPMLNIVEPQVEEEPDYEYIDTVEALRLQRLVQPERQPQVPARPEEKVNECYVPFDGNYIQNGRGKMDDGNLYSTLDRGKQCGANGKELPKCELNVKKLPKCEPNGKELPICEEIDNDMYLPSDGKKFPDDSDIEMVNQAMSIDNGKELPICTEVENDMYLSSDSYNIGKKLPTDDGMIDNDLYLTSSEFCSG